MEFFRNFKNKWDKMKNNSYKQNRLRAIEFKNIFIRHGYKIVHCDTLLDSSLKKAQIKSFQLNSKSIRIKN